MKYFFNFTAYNEKVVLFLRQTNVMSILQDKYPMLKKNDGLKTKINTVVTDGTSALRKYRNHVELTVLLSMFENEIMSFVPAHLRTHQEQTSPKGSPGNKFTSDKVFFVLLFKTANFTEM